MSLEHDHHDHAGHGHGHGTSNFGKAFAIGMSLNMAFVIVQVVFGIRGKRPGNTVLTRSVSVAWFEAAGCLSRR